MNETALQDAQYWLPFEEKASIPTCNEHLNRYKDFHDYAVLCESVYMGVKVFQNCIDWIVESLDLLWVPETPANEVYSPLEDPINSLLNGFNPDFSISLED
jgi:hypothetical protein